MSKGTSAFRQSDVTRAVKGVIHGGIPPDRITRVVVDPTTGKIIITTMNSEPVSELPPDEDKVSLW